MTMKKVYLTLAAIVRDQEHYIREWLAFHRLVGVERFVIVLHRCKDRTEEMIRKLPFADSVFVHHVEGDRQHVQLGAYRWIHENYGGVTRWMMFLDSDEFLFGVKQDDLRMILPRYEKHGAVAAHWLLFGSSGHVLRPPMPSIRYFTRCQPNSSLNRGLKSIVRADDVTNIVSTHLFVTKSGTVREHGDPVDIANKWRSEAAPTRDILQCNHYQTRSMQDWVDRRKRGSCNDPRPSSHYDVDKFYEYHTDTVEDTRILRFACPLEKMLGECR